MGLRSFFHRLTAPPVTGKSPEGPCKMVCVVNHGLKMGKGKIAAQVGHGAVMATMKAGSLKPLFVEQWLATGQKKVCLKGADADHLLALEQLAKEEGVDMRIVADRVGEVRQRDSDGRKVYTLWDLYHHADFVTYPSTYEGFGNALLEAIYFRKPVLINRYSIFVRDIEPKGFRLLTIDGFVTPTIARQVRQILTDSELSKEIVNHNYEVARQFYSYSTIRSNLRAFIADLTGY